MAPSSIGRGLAGLAAMLALSLLLGLPAIPGHMLGPGHRGPVLEGALLILLPWRPGRAAIWGVALLCWLILLLRLADMASMMTAGRLFEPAFDPALLPALWDVMARGPGGLLTGAALVAALAGLLCLCRWLAGVMLRTSMPVLPGLGLLALVTLLGMQPPDRGPLGALWEQGQRWRAAERLEAQLAAVLADDPAAAIPAGQHFAGLRGRPVVLAWVASYGQSALTDPRQAGPVGDRLRTLQHELADAGFRMRSGLVESPVRGGRSWLAHGTLRAGIRQDQPLAQHMVLATGRCGLVCTLNRAGWHTMAAMPGLTLPWLEGPAWGFETVMDRAAFTYAGPSYGWSPMPDQALLASLSPDWDGPRALYLEIVLTSSHAPWTPLPPWKGASTGLVDGSAYAGDDPRADYTNMAAGYGRSLDYSLRALGDWLTREVPGDALVIILGDHPALDWISAGQGQRVPLHVLSRDSPLLDRLDGLDLTDGMVPAAGATALPMWDIFEQLLARFGPMPLQSPPIHADMHERAGEATP